MLIMLVILIATVVMLIAEVIRIDLIAILCMLALGWTGILEPSEMLSGFSSNAVIAVIAVMIMGTGIARTGMMERFSKMLLNRLGNNSNRITAGMSLIAGLISGFIQNIGTAVIFLPGLLYVSRQTRIPASMILMPVGFAIILGGTITMVGSGQLILVNDLLQAYGFSPYGLFSIAPVGLLLLLAGIAFFYFFGEYVLPRHSSSGRQPSAQEKLIAALQLPSNIWYYSITANSPLVGQTTEQSGIWDRYNINIIGISSEKGVIYAPWRETEFRSGQEIALLGSEENIKNFASEYDLLPEQSLKRFERLRDPEESGFAEVIVPPRSEAIGKTIRSFSMRRRFAVEPLRLFSKGEESRGDLSDHRFSAGDVIIVYGLWEKIRDMKESIDFVVATPFHSETKDQSKTWAALFSLLIAVGFTLSGVPISMAFLTGAAAMLLLRVISMQQAYHGIEWKIVFLIAGLIPLGLAMQKTGTAIFLAEQMMGFIGGNHPLLLVLAVGVLSTVFSLFMSNIGAIVVLAPLVAGIATMAGIEPRPLVLMAAVCASNSFILPTQQVNALLMTTGNYRNTDFIKAGGAISLIFLIITIFVFYVFYL